MNPRTIDLIELAAVLAALVALAALHIQPDQMVAVASAATLLRTALQSGKRDSDAKDQTSR
jgi:hypothetical protein